MTQAAILLVAAAAAAVLLGLFVRWERTGKEHYAVILLLAMLVAETSLYENQDNMPRDLFHPGSGAFEFRLPEVIITLALLARLVVRGRATRVGVPPLLWAAFGAWIAVAAVEGILRHNDLTALPYEAKVIIYVVGGYALAAGVPIQRFFEGRAFERLVRWSAVAATVLVVMSAAHKSYAITCPCSRCRTSGPTAATPPPSSSPSASSGCSWNWPRRSAADSPSWPSSPCW